MPIFTAQVIDILFYIILLLAIVRGWRKGLVMAFFSMICLLLGLAAAVKLSAWVAARLGSDLQLSARWLPVLSFVLVFVVVVILVRLLARVVEKIIDFALLGWLNRLAGILLFIVLYLSVYSVLLFYGTRMQLLSPQTIASSHWYPLILPWGPGIIRFMAKFIPLGQDMFAVLESFFDKISRKIS